MDVYLLFFSKVEEIAREHDSRLTVDCTRAYHFGARCEWAFIELIPVIVFCIMAQRGFFNLSIIYSDSIFHVISYKPSLSDLELVVENVSTFDISLMSVLRNGLFTRQCCEVRIVILLMHEISYSHILECMWIVLSVVSICSEVVLNYLVLCCIVLYCIVLYCIVLYCIVLYCIVLYCIMLYCVVLYCVVLYCVVL